MEEYPDGSLILTPVEVFSAFELNLMKDQMLQKRLMEFDQWESSNSQVESNLEQLVLSGEA